MTPSNDHEAIQIEVYSARSLLELRNFETIWTALRKPLVPAERYGRVRPYKHRMTANTGVAFELFDKDRRLMFGNRQKSFQGSIKRTVDGLNIWWFRIVSTLWQAPWIDWLFELCNELPILFGSVCSFAEHDAKHGVITTFPEGRSRGQIGASLPELYRFLPGIYWLTVLGSELTENLDIDAARRLAGLRTVELGSGQLAFQLDSDPFASGAALRDRLLREKQVATALGDDHFFDRDRPERKLQPVPRFAAVLDALRKSALTGGP